MVTGRKDRIFIRALPCVVAMLLISPAGAAANLLKCRHKIGGVHTAAICHCPENDILRCDLARAREILDLVGRRHGPEGLINAAGELEHIIDYLRTTEAKSTHRGEITGIIDRLESFVAADTGGQTLRPALVISFAKLATYAGHYGSGREGTARNVLSIYENVEKVKTEYWQNYDEWGFRIERGRESLFPILRTTIYNLDARQLPECPQIILRYNPHSCEIKSKQQVDGDGP